MQNPITLIEAHKKRVDKMNGEIELPPNGTSLDLLQAVYRNADLPLVTRMRAASMAIAYEMPKLAVVAQVSEKDFAEVLERRLKHAKMIEAKMANGHPKQIEGPTKTIEVPK